MIDHDTAEQALDLLDECVARDESERATSRSDFDGEHGAVETLRGYINDARELDDARESVLTLRAEVARLHAALPAQLAEAWRHGCICADGSTVNPYEVLTI